MSRCYSCSAVCCLLRAACSAAEKPYIASMGIYVTKASALKELLEQHMPDANDFGNEVIPGARKMGYPVQVRGALQLLARHGTAQCVAAQHGGMIGCQASRCIARVLHVR